MSEPASRAPGLDAPALLASARAAWGSGDPDGAVRRWRLAGVLAPSGVAPYVNLARALADCGSEQAWLERAAASLAVDDALVARNLGVLSQQGGRPAAAIRHLRRAVVLAPGQETALGVLAKLPGADAVPAHDPMIWSVRAALCGSGGPQAWLEVLTRLTGAGRAEEAARRAAAIQSSMVGWSDDLLRLAVHLFTKTVRNVEARAALDLLVARVPDDANARRVRALVLRRSGDMQAAIREARRAVALLPSSFDNLSRLGNEVARSEDHVPAVAVLRRCLCADPSRRLEVIENLGTVLIKEHADAAASAALREAIVCGPGRAQPYMNLSTLLFQGADVARAARFGQMSLVIDSGVAAAQYNLGVIRRHQGRVPEARTHLDRAIDLTGKPLYRFVRAMLELGDGDPVEGVRRFEERWDEPTFSSSRRLGSAPTLPLPVWRGERMPEATLAVWAEQGIGDELWFAGYLPWAVDRVGKVVLEVAGSLQQLMQRSFPAVDVRARDAAGTTAALLAADMQIPLGGLMMPYDAGSRSVPTGYLTPDAQRVAAMRRRYLDGRGASRLVGISWRSLKAIRGVRSDRQAVKAKPGRSFEAPLEQWGALFAIRDTVFVSLQYGDVADDARLVRDRFGVELIVDPDVDAYRDLNAFAAQVAAVDAVVSIGNSTVAMAHALDKTVEVIARVVQDDWRYTRWAPTTRWLPTAHCTWQTSAQDWATPIATVADRLRRAT